MPKRNSKSVPTIGPFMQNNGELVREPKEIAKMLKQQYENVFSPPNEKS